jgi:predicted RNA-binding protein YlqC (UPF0109 family)
MEDFLKFLLKPLLSEPKKLHITIQGNSIVVKVADIDVGRIIGKHGSVIHSLRTLLKTYCATHQLTYVSLVLDSPKKEPEPASS